METEEWVTASTVLQSMNSEHPISSKEEKHKNYLFLQIVIRIFGIKY